MLRGVRLLALSAALLACGGVSIPPPGPGTGAPPASSQPRDPSPVPAPWDVPASAPAAVRDASSSQFEQEIRAFEAADKERPPKPGAVVFVGSSSIRLWSTLERDFPRHRVMNRGFGGSRIPNVTDFADRVVIPYAPRLVVFFAGSNDVHAGASAERVVADFRAFVARVRAALPTVRIAFVSITTSPSRFAEVETVRAANSGVRDYVATDAGLAYIDVFSAMLDARGAPLAELYGDDRLHLNAKGYALWAKLIEPQLGPAD